MNHESNNRSLYLLAGIGAFIAMFANLLDVIFGFGNSELVTYGTKSAEEWFQFFASGWFKGLYALGILNIIYMTSMLFVYLGVFAVHRERYYYSSLFAMLLSITALAIYTAANAAIPMLALADKYALATTESQRLALAAAVEAILARGEDFTPGSFFSMFVSGLAAITMAVIMLRGGYFSRANAWIGIVGFSFLSLFTIIATFIPAWYRLAFYVFGGIGGLLVLTWFAMTGSRFIKLRKIQAMA